MNDLEQMAIERLKAASDMSLMAYQQPSRKLKIGVKLGLSGFIKGYVYHR